MLNSTPVLAYFTIFHLVQFTEKARLDKLTAVNICPAFECSGLI